MLRTIEWGENRYKPMVMFAHTVAINAEACHELIILSRKGLILPESLGRQFSRDSWLECYRRSSNVEGVLLQFLKAPESIEESEYVKQEWSGLRRMIRAELRNLSPSERERKQGERYLNLLYRAHVRDLKKGPKGEKEVPDYVGKWFEKPEFVFFFSVSAPCFLENGCWPATLLIKAWRGDFEATEKLLRLDPIIATEARIGEQLFQLRRTNPDRHQLLMEAASKGRTSTITLADLKFSLAGLLYKWSHEWEAMILKGELLFDLWERHALPGRLEEVQAHVRRERKKQQRKSYGCALKVPAIRRLFDAVASDMGRGEIDSDLPQGEEAFRKRVNRNMNLWQSLGHWDKNRAA